MKIIIRLLVFFLISIHTKSIGQNYSPNGLPFTPQGELRILVIFAGFEDHCNPSNPVADYYNPDWPQVQSGVADCKTFPTNYQDAFYSNYSQFSTSATDKSNSNFYFQASKFSPLPLKIVADFFPERINIPGSSPNYTALYQKIQSDYPNFNWGRYDNRTNNPLYKFNNVSTSPDHKIDFVVVIWREPEGSEGSIWIDPFMFTTNYNGYPEQYHIDNICGYKQYKGLTFNKSMFRHELAHILYSSPHYNGANHTLGNRFYQTDFDYGMMDDGLSIEFCNAWERWLLGWTEIKHDLSDYTHNGIYTLKDFITTGESIRVKIPNTTDQFLWIENHRQISDFDHRAWAGQLSNSPPGSFGIPDIEPGIYMYVENILSNRTDIFNMVNVMNKVNGIKPINAGGNYDYLKPTQYTQTPSEFWNTFMYHFQRGEANPISGLNPYIRYRHDFDNNGVINGCSNSNSCGSETLPSQNITESYPIVKEIINGVPKLLYSNMGGRNLDAINAGRRSDAFQIGDTISIGANPPIINYPKYSTASSRVEPIYLNGLYIRIISISSGEITLEIKFNETDIKKDVRWCGDIILSDVPGVASNYDLNIKTGKTLTLNKSGIPNRLTPGNDGDFINRTVFTIASSGYMNMEANSKINLDASKFVIENGGTLKLSNNAHFLATNGALLHVKTGGTLILNSNSQIEAINNSNICIESGATVLFNDVTASIKINTNEYRGSLSATTGSSLTISGTAIPTGLNYRSSVTSNSYAYFTSGRSVLRGTNSITFNTVTTLSPGSGSTLLAYVDASNFSSNCTTVNNYKLAAINYDEFNEVFTHSHIHGSIDEQEVFFSPNASSGKLILYPNPSGSFVSIELRDNVVYNSKDIRVYNSTGKEVFPEGITINSPTQVHLDISNLETGIYVIRAGSNGNMASEKIIKGAH